MPKVNLCADSQGTLPDTTTGNVAGHPQQLHITSGEFMDKRFEKKTKDETKDEKILEDIVEIGSLGRLICYWHR